MANYRELNLTSRKVAPKRKNCGFPGCCNKIQNGGVCYRHGAKVPTCCHPDCNNNIVNSGVCRKHGAKAKTCGHENCKNIAVKGGICRRHGSVAKKCSHGGCTNNAKRFGVCRRHGAYKKLNSPQLAHDDAPSSESSSSQSRIDTTTRRVHAACSRNTKGVAKSVASSHMESLYTATTIVHVTQPVEHFDYDASPTIVNLGIENFHPI